MKNMAHCVIFQSSCKMLHTFVADFIAWKIKRDECLWRMAMANKWYITEKRDSPCYLAMRYLASVRLSHGSDF
jgi:hypothetical protein